MQQILFTAAMLLLFVRPFINDTVTPVCANLYKLLCFVITFILFWRTKKIYYNKVLLAVLIFWYELKFWGYVLFFEPYLILDTIKNLNYFKIAYKKRKLLWDKIRSCSLQ